MNRRKKNKTYKPKGDTFCNKVVVLTIKTEAQLLTTLNETKNGEFKLSIKKNNPKQDDFKLFFSYSEWYNVSFGNLDQDFLLDTLVTYLKKCTRINKLHLKISSNLATAHNNRLLVCSASTVSIRDIAITNFRFNKLSIKHFGSMIRKMPSLKTLSLNSNDEPTTNMEGMEDLFYAMYSLKSESLTQISLFPVKLLFLPKLLFIIAKLIEMNQKVVRCSIPINFAPFLVKAISENDIAPSISSLTRKLRASIARSKEPISADYLELFLGNLGEAISSTQQLRIKNKALVLRLPR